MMIQLLNQARKLVGARGPRSNTQWYGQFGFACPQLGFHEYLWGSNRVVNQGLNHFLNVGLRGTGAISTFYLAPFAADVTPSATVTAANFGATLTEFTNYTQATRPVWTSDAAATAQFLENAVAPALYTVDVNAQSSIYGAGLLSVGTKSSGSGILVAAAKAPTAFTGLAAGFEVRIKYKLTGTSS